MGNYTLYLIDYVITKSLVIQLINIYQCFERKYLEFKLTIKLSTKECNKRLPCHGNKNESAYLCLSIVKLFLETSLDESPLIHQATIQMINHVYFNHMTY